MARFHSPVVNYNAKEQLIFEQSTSITSLYEKFLQTGSIGNVTLRERSITISEDKINEIE